MIWGALLQSAKYVRSVTLAPWLFIPGLFIVATVLAYKLRRRRPARRRRPLQLTVLRLLHDW